MPNIGTYKSVCACGLIDYTRLIELPKGLIHNLRFKGRMRQLTRTSSELKVLPEWIGDLYCLEILKVGGVANTFLPYHSEGGCVHWKLRGFRDRFRNCRGYARSN